MTQNVTEPVWLKPDEAAALLNISYSSYNRHVYPAVRRGEIRAARLGRLVRINRASLLRWAAAQESEYDTLANL